MIGSEHPYPYGEPAPYHSDRGRSIFWTIVVLGLALLAACVLPRLATAASLRVCVKDDTSPNISTAPVYLNGNPFHPNLLDGSSLSGTTRCNVLPIPATVVRGQSFTTTVKYANAVGEVSAPSNGVPFFLQGAPPVPVLDSVQVVVP